MFIYCKDECKEAWVNENQIKMVTPSYTYDRNGNSVLMGYELVLVDNTRIYTSEVERMKEALNEI